MKESALGLLIPEDTDAPQGPTQIGGNAERTDALLQAGGVAKRLYIAGETSRTSATTGSFTTPVKVTLPVVKARQLVEIFFSAFFLDTTGYGKWFRFSIGGNLTTESAPGPMDNQWHRIVSTSDNLGGFAVRTELTNPSDQGDKLLSGIVTGIDSTRFLVKSDATNYSVEMLARAEGAGTVTLSQPYLAAKVWG